MKITDDGLAPAYIDLMIGKVRLDMPYIVLRTEKGKMVILSSKFIQKRRTARTKLVRVGKGDKVINAVAMTEENIVELFTDPERFKEGFRVVNKKDGFNKELFDKLLVKRR